MKTPADHIALVATKPPGREGVNAWTRGRSYVILLLWALVGVAAAPGQDRAVNPHGALPGDVDCSACHRTDAWKPLRADLAFDHNQQTRFPLTGSHARTACATCHADLRFDAPRVTDANDCATCHLDVHQGAFSGGCVDCHNTTSFEAVEGIEIHNRTRFPLTGTHAQISCQSCHLSDEGGAFTLLDAECLACHEPDYQAAHGGKGFPTTCQTCHTTLAWAATPPFDHALASGGFALLGAHQPLACNECHREPDFQLLSKPAGPDDCLSCHQADYDQQHAGSGFPTACLECHNVDAWQGAVFDHAAVARGFDLLAAHAGLDCAACHGPPPDLAPRFSPADENDCLSCHQADYDQQHAGSGFPTTCQTCHNADAWQGAVFEHTTAANGFAMLGAHQRLPCTACHAPPPDFTPLFSPLNQDDCVSCHQTDYDQQHAGSGFPTTCLACHNTDAWEGTVFDHGLVARGFDLIGAHDALDCAACHAPPPGFEPLFSPLNQDDCVSCHQTDYDQQHAGSGFPTECIACHNTDAWEGTVFDHGLVANGFGLIGAHDALDCAACHAPPPGFEPLFSPLNQDDCVSCHQTDYDQQHAGSGFPTTCLACHNTDAWEGTVFDHGLVANGFGLVGAHTELECSSCHAPPPGFEPLFSPLNQDDCLSCHQADYDGAHAGSGFPTTCQTCHDTEAWQGAVFEHAAVANGFALLGAHAPLPCVACHAPPPGFEPLFSPLNQDDCVSCHQADYDQQHAGSGFPTECIACHNVDTWQDVNFDHASVGNGFRLLGAHQTLACTDCHAPPPDFTPLFNPASDQDCLSCHQADYDQQHAADGFPFECLTCHNTNDWQDASFDHAGAAGGFRLLGAHEALPCSACHTPPPDFTPLFDPTDDEDCFTCHQPDYQQAHGGQGFPTTCLTCHNTTDWDDTDFDHDSDFFPIFSGRHDGEWDTCATCHTDPDDFNVFTCLVCHEHRQSEMDERHEGVPGYVYESNACYTCHPTGEED